MLEMADESLSEVSTMDITKLKVPDLKKELKLRGLSTVGNKNELIERLQTAMKNSDNASAESVDDLDEDLLNDDDDEHLDTSESVINDLDQALDDSPTTKAMKRKISESVEDEVKTCAPKKIILNRKNSIVEACQGHKDAEEKSSSEAEDTNNGAESTDNETDKTDSARKIITFSKISAKERLEMRAKKFGTPVGDVAKKTARAMRFASKGKAESSLSPDAIKVNEEVGLDVLKQRAQRFGGSVSTVMSSLEQKEKMELRKARFSNITNTNGAVSDSDKAKQRIERFKQPVK